MAWEARSGLKRLIQQLVRSISERLNGLGSPFGFETTLPRYNARTCQGLNGLGSPFGFET